MSDDIYSAPQSELTTATTLDGFGSLEKGVSGDYQFTIGDTISEAWEKTSGAKGSVWLAMLVYMVISSVASMFTGIVPVFLLGDESEPNGMYFTASGIGQFIQILVTVPLTVGISALGLRRAVGAKMDLALVVKYFNSVLPLFGLTLLMYLLVSLGFMLLVLPGIYLVFAYLFAQLLMVDKGLGIWQALEASRKAVTHRWFAIFGFFLLLGLINLLGVLTIIGWIWTVPLSVVAFGVAYRNLFGCESTTAA